MPFRRRKQPPAPSWSPALAEEFASAIDAVPERSRASLRTALAELSSADPLYAPTSFWRPGVERIMSDIEERGLSTFKSWPSAAFFFYPRYSPAFSYAQVDEVLPALLAAVPKAPENWLRSHLIGAADANRDIDVVLAQLDTQRLPLDVENQGESEIGTPPQRYRPFGPQGPAFGKAHLNYLKILSAASHHMTRPIRTVVEIGGGYGALGEILLAGDTASQGVQYVDVDIPPLTSVAHHYLTELFPSRTIVSNAELGGDPFRLDPAGPTAALSAWQLPQIEGSADLFVNSFSFQEMEPHVVQNYAAQIARLDAGLVVSLNSRKGKPKSSDAEVGVESQVTSDFIVDAFASHGYEPAARVGRPTAPPQAECVILRKR